MPGKKEDCTLPTMLSGAPLEPSELIDENGELSAREFSVYVDGDNIHGVSMHMTKYARNGEHRESYDMSVNEAKALVALLTQAIEEASNQPT